MSIKQQGLGGAVGAWVSLQLPGAAGLLWDNSWQDGAGSGRDRSDTEVRGLYDYATSWDRVDTSV